MTYLKKFFSVPTPSSSPLFSAEVVSSVVDLVEHYYSSRLFAPLLSWLCGSVRHNGDHLVHLFSNVDKFG
jgi:hypothetical protein